jgi:enolase
MTPAIERLFAREILDSRGRPTVSARCELSGGVAAAASVPSGMSTGAAEGVELRDGDRSRYRGLGCRKAVASINGEINHALAGMTFSTQTELDQALISLDGTPNKSRLGANAILAVSVAFARAVAAARGVPLYRHLADLLGLTPSRLPRLTINLFSGGKHAGQQMAIQDVLIVPAQASTIDDSLAMAFEVYQCAAELIYERYGMRLLTADEGGLAPPFENTRSMLETAIDSIHRAGLRPGTDMALAIDVASSHFFRNGRYHIDSRQLDSGEMIAMLLDWIRLYPIVSLEDGLAEDDWVHWPILRGAAGKVLIVGDDLLCTNPARISRAIEEKSCNTLLLKVNQIGTLSEAADAYRQARSAGWMVTISVRSGETEDNWAADLAVGWSGDQFKNGSMTQSERLSKYNRLLAIEDETGYPIIEWPNRGAQS